MAVRSTPTYPLYPEKVDTKQRNPPNNSSTLSVNGRGLSRLAAATSSLCIPQGAAVSLSAPKVTNNNTDEGLNLNKNVVPRPLPISSAQLLLEGVRPPGFQPPTTFIPRRYPSLLRGLQPPPRAQGPGLILRFSPRPLTPPQGVQQRQRITGNTSGSPLAMSTGTKTKSTGEKNTAMSSSSRVCTRLGAAQAKALLDEHGQHDSGSSAALYPVVVLDRAVVKKNIEAQTHKGVQRGRFANKQRDNGSNLNLASVAETVAVNLGKLNLSPNKKRRVDIPIQKNRNLTTLQTAQFLVDQNSNPRPLNNNSGLMGNADSAPNNQNIEYELIDLSTPPGSPPMSPGKAPCSNKDDTGLKLGADTVNSKGTKIRRLSVQDGDGFQLLWNVEDCNCQFCGSALETNKGVMLNNCLHVFCLDCIESTIHQQGIQTKCPLNDGSKCGCQSFLMEKEIIGLLAPEVYASLVAQSVQNAKQDMNNIFECATPNCEGWCEFEAGTKTFHCYVCLKTNCLICKAIHENVDCNTYQTTLQQAQKSVEGTRGKINTDNNNDGWDQLLKLGEFRGWNMDNIMEQLQACDILIPTLQFECPICISEVAPGDGVMLQECLHMFCRECMVEMIRHSDEPEIKCAFIDGNFSCVDFLKAREIRALLPPDVYELHLQRSVKLAENAMTNSYHCKTPDCPGWCELDDDQAGAGIFKCYVCKKRNCLECKVIHAGSCADYKNSIVQDENEKLSEEALKKMVESGSCMHCPKCNFMVEKSSGCDWIVCTRCRTEICWATKGPRWGPAGKNDTSGGCKCDWKNRKPCVSTCQNCH